MQINQPPERFYLDDGQFSFTGCFIGRTFFIYTIGGFSIHFDEEKHLVREGLRDEEELAVFDILTNPDMNLSNKERKQVKRIARSLLDNLKTQKFVLDWKKKQQTRADVRLTINTFLDQLPSVFTKKIYNQKCDSVYKYVYDMEAKGAKTQHTAIYNH